MRNVDILAEVASRNHPPFTVGFAAETSGDLGDAALDKLKRKGCDRLVANDVSQADAGFDAETNRVVIYAPDRDPEAVDLRPKRGVAAKILSRLAEIL